MSSRRGVWAVLMLLAAPLAGCAAAAPAQIEALSYRDNRVLSFPADSTGLRAALDSLRTAGGVVTVPSGVYTITRPLTLWPNTTLAGEGWATVIRLQAPVNTPVRALRVSRRCRVANLTLRGTGYISSDPKAYGGTGIIGGADEYGGMDSTVIEGCHVTGWNTNGINMAPRSSHNVVKNNTIDSCGWEGIYAAQYDNNNLILGNRITDCRHNAIDVVGNRNVIEANIVRDIGMEIPTTDFDNYGILIYSRANTTGPIADNVIRNNSVENALDGICVIASTNSDNHRAVVTANSIIGCRRYGILIGGGGNPPMPRVNGVRIESNRIGYCGADGILLKRIPHAAILRTNEIYANKGNGIQILSDRDGVDSTTIDRNAIWGNSGYGVLIGADAKRSVVRNNTFGPNRQGTLGSAPPGTQVEGNREPPAR